MVLLDTCAIIWDALSPEKLTSSAKRAIELADKHNEVIICDISFWEISMLIKRNRLQIDVSADNFLNLFLQVRNSDVQCITPDIAAVSVNFGDDLNKDPADRLIAATSIVKNVPIVTADRNLRNSKLLATIW